MIEIMLAYIFRKLNNPGDGSGDGGGTEIDPEVFDKLEGSGGSGNIWFAYSVAVSGDGSTVVVGAQNDIDKGIRPGSAYIFIKQPNGSYLETQRLVASGGADKDSFGINVAISRDGSTIVVGAFNDDDKGSNSGSAYIFTKQVNGSYIQTQRLLASDGAASDYFGISVAVSGDGSAIVVGAYQDDDRGTNSGSAYIFTKQANGSYLQTQKLVASDGAASDWFGYHVAISSDGSTVVVGAYQDDDKGTDSGSTYIFTKQANGSYLQTQKLVASDGASKNYFGYGVTISEDGSTIVIGANGDDDKGGFSGSVYIFTKQANGSYLETQKLTASDGAVSDNFGANVAVSVDGSTVVVGSNGDDDKGTDSGSTYIFTKQADGSYLQTQKLLASDGASNDRFGHSVAISNTSVVIGACSNLGKGAVYIFGRPNNSGDGSVPGDGGGTGLEINPEIFYKSAGSGGAVGDEFGYDVAVTRDGTTVVVGARLADDKGTDSGSAYVFKKQANGSYLQTQKLLAADGSTNDQFGVSVAISADGSTIVVGTHWDDNKHINSGSVYVFTKQANGSYSQTRKLVASDGFGDDYFGISVAISVDGSTIVVGAPNAFYSTIRPGSVYIFTKQSNGSYLETQRLLASDGAAEDRFGTSVAITDNGSTVVVGNHMDDDRGKNSGAAYIFTKQSNGSYLETQKLLADDGEANDWFGWRVDITADGSTIVIGAHYNSIAGPFLGSAYIFTKEVDGSYFETQKLLASDGVDSDHFGYDVAISADGSTIVIGASWDNAKGQNAGSTYIFTKQPDGSYLETHKLLASDGRIGDNFGWSLAISNTSLVIGAPRHLNKGVFYVY